MITLFKKIEPITKEQGHSVSCADFNLQENDEQDAEKSEDSDNVANYEEEKENFTRARRKQYR